MQAHPEPHDLEHAALLPANGFVRCLRVLLLVLLTGGLSVASPGAWFDEAMIPAASCCAGAGDHDRHAQDASCCCGEAADTGCPCCPREGPLAPADCCANCDCGTKVPALDAPTPTEGPAPAAWLDPLRLLLPDDELDSFEPPSQSISVGAPSLEVPPPRIRRRAAAHR